jgi:primase-polymerase (primpol)-like protein
VPYYANGNRRYGDQGSDKDRAQLVTLTHAMAALAVPRANAFTGIGFAFLPDDGLIGIDIDKCIDAETGEISAIAEEVIAGCHSYTEYSPSRTGVHYRGRSYEDI